MPREVTDITIAEDGTESHESWLLIRAGKVSSMGPRGGARLFDSEIGHQHYIVVTISRCWRKRDLKRDWMHATQTLAEIAMSHAQWGAFVSSFGDGGGVPATLQFLVGDGMVAAAAEAESRLSVSARDVRTAGNEAFAEIKQRQEAIEEAFERGAGKREMRELIRSMHYAIQNAPANMEFAAESLTEHAENVVTKARSDIEAMAVQAAERGLTLDAPAMAALGVGEAAAR